jgi:hypothetical protein
MPIAKNEKGTCPHCKTPNRFEYARYSNGQMIDGFDIFNGPKNDSALMQFCRCTNCGEVIIFFKYKMIYPLGATRPPCPAAVPDPIAKDYKEASLVESYSQKAAAALARRCLQNLLHDQGITKKNLNDEIEEAMTRLPSHLNGAIDAVRTIGNFAAHPIKYEHTGEIIEVEPGEAEWSLDVLEQLFDFYYVAPTELEAKRTALNEKLKQAGKPPLK